MKNPGTLFYFNLRFRVFKYIFNTSGILPHNVIFVYLFLQLTIFYQMESCQSICEQVLMSLFVAQQNKITID